MDTIDRIRAGKIITIVRDIPENAILPLAEALCAGGIDLMEVTFLQDRPDTWRATADSICAIGTEFKGKMLAGAGTVMTEEQLTVARDAGARYIISPNTDEKIICRTKQMGLVSIPGAFTPTECAFAASCGADFVKLFPAGNMGAGYVKALRAPLSHIKFLAVGGITEKNAGDFINAGCCGIGVGGSLANRDWIMNNEFDRITFAAAAFRKAVNL